MKVKRMLKSNNWCDLNSEQPCELVLHVPGICAAGLNNNEVAWIKINKHVSKITVEKSLSSLYKSIVFYWRVV